MPRSCVIILAILTSLCLLPVNDIWAGSLFGPKTYTRTTGQPNTYSESFSNCEPQAQYELRVQNGLAGGSQRLSSATVVLNGQTVLSPNDLNHKVYQIVRPVPMLSENALEVRLASGPGGQLTISIECVANCFEVAISSQVPGAILNQHRVLVTGTVSSSSEEVGVTVNTGPGYVSGPPFSFAVPEVPLGLGLNILTAIATNSCGMQATASTEVNVQSLQEPLVILSANPSAGVAPLNVQLRALAIPPNPVVSYTWNFTAQTGSELSVIYDAAGLYFPQVTVTDAKGLTYTATAVVNVLDPARLNVLLQAKWADMREALSQGDVEQALSYFTKGSQDQYRQIFEAIQEKLPEEAANLQDIALVSFSGTTAKYRIQRTVTINGQPQTLTYWVYFIQDADGIWRIKQF